MKTVIFLTNPSFKFHHSEGYWLLFRKSFFILEEDLLIIWRHAGKIWKITIKKGFITDFASIPRILWNIFPPWDEIWGLSTIGHDGLYSIHAWENREMCDRFIGEGVESQGGGEFTQHSFYDQLRLWGWIAWMLKSKRSIKENSHFVKIEEHV